MTASDVNAFFADVETTGLPSGNSTKAQPWKEFHKPEDTLQRSGSIVVDMVSKPGEDNRSIGYPLTLAVPPKKAAAAAAAAAAATEAAKQQETNVAQAKEETTPSN